MLQSNWIYIIEFGILQLLIGFFFGNTASEGRNGAILGLLFSGPITIISVWLDHNIIIIEDIFFFGILFSIVALIILIISIIKENE